MSFDYLKNKRQLTIIVLLGVSLVSGAVALAKVRGFFVTSARAQSLVKKAVAGEKTDPNDVQVYLADAQAIVEALKKKNVFASPEPRRHPVSAVSGILGDEAFINGTWYKVGDKIGDATVVAIDPTVVKIEWDGKETSFAPISAVTIGSASSSWDDRKKREDKKHKEKHGKTEDGGKPGKTKPSSASVSQKQAAKMEAELAAKRRAKLLKQQQVRAMDEAKRRALKSSSDASKKQKQQINLMKKANSKKR